MRHSRESRHSLTLNLVVVVVVVVTFFNHNFVNCKATLIWRLKIYEIKYNISLMMTYIHSNNEIDKRINVCQSTAHPNTTFGCTRGSTPVPHALARALATFLPSSRL